MSKEMKKGSCHPDEELKVQDLQSVLRKGLECKELELVDYTARRLVPLGENYLSVILGIEATIRRSKDASERGEMIHIAAKIAEGPQYWAHQWADLLRKELFVYTELLPTYRSMEREAGMSESCFSPKLIGYRYSVDVENDDVDKIDESGLILMENLAERGYYSCDRIIGMDTQHARVAVSALARYAALGAALRHKRPDFLQSSLAVLRKDCLGLERMKPAFGLMKKMFQEDERFAKHAPTLVACYDRIIGEERAEAREPWISVIHGDFRCSNLLAHRDEQGNVDDVKFVDFQTYDYTSCARDLPYFLCGSFADLANESCVDEILDLYYDTFIATLERLGCDVAAFTRESFERELKERANEDFAYIALTLKFMLHRVTGEESSDAIRRTLITRRFSDDYVDKMFSIVDMYRRKNWF